MLGRAARTSASSPVRSTALLPYMYPEIASSTVGSTWLKRSMTDWVPNSGAQLAQIAPMTGRGEERDEGLGLVGQIPDDAVTLLHTQGHEPGTDSGHLGAQLANVSVKSSRVWDTAVTATSSACSGVPNECSA